MMILALNTGTPRGAGNPEISKTRAEENRVCEEQPASKGDRLL